jgi:hypothetical protein
MGPVRRHVAHWKQDEVPPVGEWVWQRQDAAAALARRPATNLSAKGNEVEIERAGSPSAPCAATGRTLDIPKKAEQHCRSRIDIDQRHGIQIRRLTASADRRSLEKARQGNHLTGGVRVNTGDADAQ